jgi:hypothetical protein
VIGLTIVTPSRRCPDCLLLWAVMTIVVVVADKFLLEIAPGAAPWRT